MFLIHRSARSRFLPSLDMSLFFDVLIIMKRVSRDWSSQNSTPLTGCLENAWAGLQLPPCFYSSEGRVLIWMDRLGTLCWCSWCRMCVDTKGSRHSPVRPREDNWATLPTKEGRVKPPFLGNICRPVATTNHNFKNILFWDERGEPSLQFTYGFGFSKELAGFWNKLSLSMDLWGHHFCLTADRERSCWTDKGTSASC